MKFKCIKNCGGEIPFDDLKKHYKSNCTKKKVTFLTKEQMAKIKRENISRIKSKLINQLFFL